LDLVALDHVLELSAAQWLEVVDEANP
jgi:hypothetical protein